MVACSEGAYVGPDVIIRGRVDMKEIDRVDDRHRESDEQEEDEADHCALCQSLSAWRREN
jgi:hypothetical protein